MVSITYGHGKLYDFETVTGWTERATTADGSFATDGDVVTLTKTGAGEYYIDNDDDIGKSSTIYTKIMWRYKTSDTSIKAKIVLEFTGAEGTQEVLADESSTTWKVGSATITTAKTIDHIRLHADHAEGTVEYDFVLIYKNSFTFPTNQPENMTFTPASRYAHLKPPSRIGDITQYMGSDNATVDMICNLDVGVWKRTANPTDYIKGETFIDIHHNAKTEAWQWLDTETEQFKVTLEPPRFRRDGRGHTVDLTFKEYRLGSADSEEWYDRYGLNL